MSQLKDYLGKKVHLTSALGETEKTTLLDLVEMILHGGVGVHKHSIWRKPMGEMCWLDTEYHYDLKPDMEIVTTDRHTRPSQLWCGGSRAARVWCHSYTKLVEPWLATPLEQEGLSFIRVEDDGYFRHERYDKHLEQIFLTLCIRPDLYYTDFSGCPSEDHTKDHITLSIPTLSLTKVRDLKYVTRGDTHGV